MGVAMSKDGNRILLLQSAGTEYWSFMGLMSPTPQRQLISLCAVLFVLWINNSFKYNINWKSGLILERKATFKIICKVVNSVCIFCNKRL